MGRRRKRSKPPRPLPTTEPAADAPDPEAGAEGSREPEVERQRPNYARWRAICLSLVYVVFAAHILHWKLTGKTLAPLELNEVMYALELGIITAAFLFMSVLVLGTMIFGRFFCSWACHIMVLQDLCGWLLRKLDIPNKTIRSRALLLVPPLTALYMFVWPQVLRTWHGGALPTFHMRSDAQGWASFVTDNFWRNLPSPPVIVLTFLVCGFIIVYLLGSRSFCTYVCPYGAIFGLVDRIAPGRIQANVDACQQCGQCTAACTSGVRVHEEVKQHGMIVNPGCMKDLDCISACPHEVLHYGFTRPKPLGSLKTGRFGSLKFDFSLREDVLMAFVFLAVLLAFRGLYSRIPFLLSLALGGIGAYLTVVTLRLFTRPRVKLAGRRLKEDGQLTTRGRLFGVSALLLALLFGHSAFIRYHEFSGLQQARALGGAPAGERTRALALSAHDHLRIADRWGLISNERVERGLAEASLELRRFEELGVYAGRLLARRPGNLHARLRLAQSLVGRDRTADAERELAAIVAACRESEKTPRALASSHQVLAGIRTRQRRFADAIVEMQRVLTLDPKRARIHSELGGLLAAGGKLEEAVTSLRQAVRLDPGLGRAHYNLGAILARRGEADEAIRSYQAALATLSGDADVHNNLGHALLRQKKTALARAHLERAVTIDPRNAAAHFNLARVHALQGDEGRAREHLTTAARLDPRYAR